MESGRCSDSKAKGGSRKAEVKSAFKRLNVSLSPFAFRLPTCRSVGDGDRLHLDQIVRNRQRLDAEQRARRRVVLRAVLRPHLVHQGAVLGPVADHERGDLHHVGERGAGALERDIYIAEHLLRLRREVALRSEEHTSELQSLAYLVCRLLLEKKNKTNIRTNK